MWVGPDGVVVAPAMVVELFVALVVWFGCEVLLRRELLLRLSNY